MPIVGADTTTAQINRLLPDTMYECCVTAHILTNLQFDVRSSSCVQTETLVSQSDLLNFYHSTIIGLATSLSVSSCLLCVCVGLTAIPVKQHIIMVKGQEE